MGRAALLIAVLMGATPLLARAGGDDDVVAAIRLSLLGSDAERARAMEALDAFEVPADPARRAAILRKALARPGRGAGVISDTVGDPATELLVATPGGYDPARSYPTLIGLTAYCNVPLASLRPFATGKPPIPWEDGLVLAPCLPDIAEFESATYVPTRKRMLALIAKANREYAVDPDRLVACGHSLGSTVAYEMASRFPDRFAAIADVSGGCPRHPTPLQNLRMLRVHVSHGDADDVVPVKVAHDIEAFLRKWAIPHAVEIVEGGKHELPRTPEHGNRIREYLLEKKRNAWPERLDLIVTPEAEPRRRLYWVELDVRSERVALRATAQDNVIEVATPKGTTRLVLHLGEPLVDLDREVVVKVDGRVRFQGKLERRWSALVRDLESDGWDTVRAAPVELDVSPRARRWL